MPNGILDALRLANIFMPQANNTIPGATPPFVPENIQINTPQTGINTPDTGFRPKIDAVFDTTFTPPMKDTGIPNYEGDRSGVQPLMQFEPDEYFLNEYKKVLANLPQRNKPSLLRRLGAIFFEPGEEQERFKDPRFYRGMADAKTMLDALEPGLTAERYANTNERQLAYQNAQAILRERDIARKEEADRKLAESRDYANQIRAQVARGGVVQVDETSGQAFMVYRDGTKVPLDINKIPPLELEEFKAANRMKEIEARGDIQKEIADAVTMRQTEITNLRADLQAQLQEARYELMGQNRWSTPIQAFDKDGNPLPFMISTNGVTGEFKKIPLEDNAFARTTPPGARSTSESALSPAAIEQQRVNRANEIINKHPQLKAFITISSNGVNVKPENTGTALGRVFGGYGNLDAKTRQKMVDYIDGKVDVFELDDVTTTKTPTPNTTLPKVGNPTEGRPLVPAGKTIMINPQGQEGYVPNEQVEAAKKQGYRVK